MKVFAIEVTEGCGYEISTEVLPYAFKSYRDASQYLLDNGFGISSEDSPDDIIRWDSTDGYSLGFIRLAPYEKEEYEYADMNWADIIELELQ